MVYASFIIGFPGETEATVRNTLELIDETAPTFYSVESYYHDPKVPIQDRAGEFGLQGRGYSWKHDTMDWREAHYLVEMLHRNIHKSTLLPLYGADMWTLPYLMSQGKSVEQFKGFLDVAKEMVLKGYDEPQPRYDAEERKLHAILGTQPAPVA